MRGSNEYSERGAVNKGQRMRGSDEYGVEYSTAVIEYSDEYSDCYSDEWW
jgi:hypothetical protein